MEPVEQWDVGGPDLRVRPASSGHSARSPRVTVDQDDVTGALGDVSQPLVLDLDETLLLRSSTEDYLDALRPRSVAQALLLALDIVRPWQALPGPRKRHVYRDWLRVLVTSVLLPWSLWRWQRLGVAAGSRHVNAVLRDAARRRSTAGTPVHVVTLGFRPVVEPLLRGMDLGTHRLVAAGLLRGWRLRRRGKAEALEEAAGPQLLARAAVVSDSLDDIDLLERCRTPLLVRWREARWEGAFSTSYQPFLYTRRGKRADQGYLLHHVLLEDVLLLVLALCWSMPDPLLGAVGLLLLHLSFWMVYEIGYWENDTLAVVREEKPNVPAGTAAFAERMKPRLAWVTALLVSVPGVLLLTAGAGPQLRSWTGASADFGRQALLLGLGWVGYLLVSRCVYWTYNRLAPETRVLPYALLQVTRTVGYTVFCSVSAVGAAALLTVVLGRWMPYQAYRATGVHPDLSHRLLFVFSFVVLGMGAVAVAPLDASSAAQGAVVLGFLVLRAHRPIRRLVADVVTDLRR